LNQTQLSIIEPRRHEVVIDQFAVLVDVRNRHTVLCEHGSEELRPVAIGWSTFAAD
jgi:hypothetical protein